MTNRKLPPLTDQWIKSAIAAGTLVPPIGGAGPSREARLGAAIGWIVAFAGLVLMAVAYGLLGR